MDDSRSAPKLSELARLHYALLYRYAYRLCGSAEEAEDLTQQAFLTAHRRLHQLRDANSAKSWLCAILRNTFLTRVSSQRAVQIVPDQLPDMVLCVVRFEESFFQICTHRVI